MGFCARRDSRSARDITAMLCAAGGSGKGQRRRRGRAPPRVADRSATGISIRATPALQRLQQDVVAAVTPFIRHGGKAAAFVGTPEGPTIGWTIAYVDNFLTKSSGPNYSPHVTAGAGDPNFVARMKAAPFAEFAFKIEGAAIYQLGDIGTARQQLWVWRP